MRGKTIVMCVAAVTAFFAATLLPGCGPFWVDPYITVKESNLNWVEIHYYNLRKSPVRRIGVEVYGSGLVVVKKGTSELVSNDFAKRYDDAEWSNIKTHRLQIDAKAANDIFQNLVNFGVLDREKTGKGARGGKFDRFIAVKANLCNNTYSDNVNMFEEDPDLAEQLLDVVREFENPAQ